MRPIGSEKLPVDQKVKRIMEIANYTRDAESNNNNNVEYSIRATNKKVYGIVRENATYVIKEGKDVNSLEYINGLRNSNTNRFKSYGSALKKLNLVLSESNRNSGNEKGLSLFGEQEEKFVLKTPEAPEEDVVDDFEMPADDEVDAGGLDDVDFSMDDEVADDEGGEEMDVDVEVSGEVEEGGPLPIKTIQKLTGKLGQKLREVEDELDSDTIKYVLNSIISAVDIDKLSAEDIEDIQDKLESDEEMDYTEEGEFDVEITGDEEMEDDGELDFSMDDEEIDLGESSLEGGEIPPVPEEDLDEIWPALRAAAGTAIGAKAGEWAGKKVFGEDELSEDMEEEIIDAPGEEEDLELRSQILDIFSESNENKVNKTIKKYFKETKNEKLRKKRISESYIKEKTQRLRNNSLAKKYFVSYEQEVKANKLMETYKVDFLGRTKKGDLLFKKQNIKVGVTPSGKIIS